MIQLNSIPTSNIRYGLAHIRASINHFKEAKNKYIDSEYLLYLRGYLNCLADLELVEQSEYQSLLSQLNGLKLWSNY